MAAKKRKKKQSKKRTQFSNKVTSNIPTVGKKMQRMGWMMLFIITIPVTGLYLFDLVGGIIGGIIGIMGLSVMNAKKKQSKD